MRLNRAEPQSPQKNLAAPPAGGSHERMRSSPCTMVNASGVVRPLTEAAVPVRRWQRVQWQYIEATNGSLTSKRTAPQLQPPVMGRLISDSLMPRAP